MKNVDDLRAEARRCIGIANETIDNKVAAAFLSYACALEQRARLIEATRQARRKTASELAERRPA